MGTADSFNRLFDKPSLVKVIRVNSLRMVGPGGGDADLEVHHELRETVTAEESDLRVNVLHI